LEGEIESIIEAFHLEVYGETILSREGIGRFPLCLAKLAKSAPLALSNHELVFPLPIALPPFAFNYP